jgi:hypothetical protein
MPLSLDLFPASVLTSSGKAKVIILHAPSEIVASSSHDIFDWLTDDCGKQANLPLAHLATRRGMVVPVRRH